MDRSAGDSLSGVTAAILAGGLGTRLRAVVGERPKVLAEVGGRPFLAYLLDQLSSAGVRKVVICTGYLGAQVKAAFGNFYRDTRLLYSQEPSPLGTAGALRLALPFFDSEFILVMNGDSFCNVDLKAFSEWHFARKAKATIVSVNSAESARYGKVHIKEGGLVASFEEKSLDASPGWINAGIYLLACSLIAAIPEDSAVSLEREDFPAWIGKDFYGYKCKEKFLDIGTPESYASAEKFFATVRRCRTA